MKILKRLVLEHIQNEKDKWKTRTPPQFVKQIGTPEFPISISMIPSFLRCEKMAVQKLMEKYDTEKEMNEKIANGNAIDSCVFLQKSGQFPDDDERITEVGKLFPAANMKFVADLDKNIKIECLTTLIEDVGIEVPIFCNSHNVYFHGTADYIMSWENGESFIFDLKCSQFGGKELVYNYLGQLAGYSVGLNIPAGGIIRATDFKTLKRGNWEEKTKIYKINDIIPGLQNGWEVKLLDYVSKRINDIRKCETPKKSMSCYPCSYCPIGISRCIGD